MVAVTPQSGCDLDLAPCGFDRDGAQAQADALLAQGLAAYLHG